MASGVEDDGTLNKHFGELRLKHYDKIVIDIGTGHVTYPSTGIREERVVQNTGVFENEYVLVPSFSFRRKKTAANAATDFIRLRAGTKTQPQAIFIAFSLNYLVSGTCAIVP
jgi:hypothetical protein